jgi:hypothetical protein
LSRGWFHRGGAVNALAVTRQFDPDYRRTNMAQRKKQSAEILPPSQFSVFGLFCGEFT